MSRTMPSECAHGYISDWGDFGSDVNGGDPEYCPGGCNDHIAAPPLTDAAQTIASLAEIVKDLERERDSARDWAVALEGQLAAIETALHLHDDEPINPPNDLDSGSPLYGWDAAVDHLRSLVAAALTGGEDDARA